MTERKNEILQFFHHVLYEGMLSGRDIPFGARLFFLVSIVQNIKEP